MNCPDYFPQITQIAQIFIYEHEYSPTDNTDSTDILFTNTNQSNITNILPQITQIAQIFYLRTRINRI